MFFQLRHKKTYVPTRVYLLKNVQYVLVDFQNFSFSSELDGRWTIGMLLHNHIDESKQISFGVFKIVRFIRMYISLLKWAIQIK